MRDIKDKIDASWFAVSPDTEQQRIHRKFKEQSHWMMVDLPRLTAIYKEMLEEIMIL